MAPAAKGKATPLPSSTTQHLPSVEDLFSTLESHIQNGSYSEAIQVSDQVLAIIPNDEDALRCKVVALIRSDNIDRALSAIQASAGIRVDLSFYKAYCLYRQNKQFESLECLKCQERNAAVLQLESQILYRLGKMDACIESYKKLQKFKPESSLELKTNMIATLVSAGRVFEVQPMMDALKIRATSSYDIAYNTACSLIEKRDYVNAEQLLLTARRIGQEVLVDGDYADDEIESELAPVTVQLAYVRHLMGRHEEAAEAYAGIISRNLADRSSLVVATNNLIALKGAKDISDGLRKLKQFIEKVGGARHFQLADGLEVKLFPKQKEAIYANLLLMMLHAKKLDQARELASVLPEMFPDSVMPILFQAAILVREHKAGKAEEMLSQAADKFPEKSTSLLLACAHIAVTVGHLQIAADSLARIPEIQHMPAMVATLVSIRERCRDIPGAVSVLESAIHWWANAMSEDNIRNLIMQEAAIFKLKHGLVKDAALLYEELIKSDKNVQMVAGLVKSAAYVDIDKAEYYKEMLKPLPGLKEINAEKLEMTPGARHGEGVNVSVNMTEALDEVKKGRAKKKRKRKPRYPKGFDPSNPGPPPDPERWLPKRERSTYRPKRKDKRAAQARGSQGAIIRERNVVNASVSSAFSSSVKMNQGASSAKSGTDQTKASLVKSRKKSKR